MCFSKADQINVLKIFFFIGASMLLFTLVNNNAFESFIAHKFTQDGERKLIKFGSSPTYRGVRRTAKYSKEVELNPLWSTNGSFPALSHFF